MIIKFFWLLYTATKTNKCKQGVSSSLQFSQQNRYFGYYSHIHFSLLQPVAFLHYVLHLPLELDLLFDDTIILNIDRIAFQDKY